MCFRQDCVNIETFNRILLFGEEYEILQLLLSDVLFGPGYLFEVLVQVFLVQVVQLFFNLYIFD